MHIAYIAFLCSRTWLWHELNGPETQQARGPDSSRLKTIDVYGLPVGVLVHANGIGSAVCKVSNIEHCQTEHNGASGERDVEYGIS
jgi:hypothetical protein